MHKRNFNLTTGECLNDDSYGIIAFDAKTEGDDLMLLLPEPDDLNGVIGTSKWMVRPNLPSPPYCRWLGGGGPRTFEGCGF